jgi:hypothetical protein
MRVYLSRPLLRIVEGVDHNLNMRVHLGKPIDAEAEAHLQEIPRKLSEQFNLFAKEDETIDFASRPIVYMPDEFTFFMDVESLGRLAREVLIRLIPLDAVTWESRALSILELWVGGRDDLISKDERPTLEKAMREVWSLPIQRKVFVLDKDSIRSHARWIGTLDAIREAGGILDESPSHEMDYYVTDRSEPAETALKSGARKVLDTLMLSVLLMNKD